MAPETCNPSAQETEGQGFQGQTRSHNEICPKKTPISLSKLGGGTVGQGL